MEVNYFDIAAAIIFLFFAVRGAVRGFIDELAGFVSIVVGFVLAKRFSNDVAAHLQAYIPEEWLVPAAFALIFFVSIIVVAIIAYFLQNLLKLLFIGFINNILGFVVGVLKAYIICVVLAYVAILFFGDNVHVSSSVVIPYLDMGINWIENISPL